MQKQIVGRNFQSFVNMWALMSINPCIKAWSFILDKIRQDRLLWYWPVLVCYNISLNKQNFGSTRLEASRPPEPAPVLVWGDEEGAEESDCWDRWTHRIQSLRKGAWCCGRVHKVFQNQNTEIVSNRSQNMLQFLTQWSRFDNLKETCSMSKPSPIYFENQGNFLRKGKVLALFKSQPLWSAISKVGDWANYFSAGLSAEWDLWAEQVGQHFWIQSPHF